MLRITVLFLFSLLLSNCGGSLPSPKAVSNLTEEARAKDVANIQQKIESIAERADHGLEEAWICGRNARVLKTGYAGVSPKGKAEFAIAYEKMLESTKENLAQDLKSYIPYSTRAKFAHEFWIKSDSRQSFEKEKKKKKIQWIYESLLDASELFWRAYEQVHPEQVNSAAVLAHYKEQDMVFNYMEDEKTPGSFSGEYVKWAESEEDKSDK